VAVGGVPRRRAARPDEGAARRAADVAVGRLVHDGDVLVEGWLVLVRADPLLQPAPPPDAQLLLLDMDSRIVSIHPNKK
jgi:hypothetical protein